MESPINKVLFSFTCLGADTRVSEDGFTEDLLDGSGGRVLDDADF